MRDLTTGPIINGAGLRNFRTNPRHMHGGEGVPKCVIFDVCSIFEVQFLSENFPLYMVMVGKDRPKVEISVSAETESHTESGIRLSAETKITPKETTRFRPKSQTETESACDLSLCPRVRMWTWINLYIFVDFMLINVNTCNKNISAHTLRHIQYIQLYLVRCKLFWSTPISGLFLVTLYNY